MTIAVYGSDKKFAQNFKPFIEYCEKITTSTPSRRVRLPVCRVVITTSQQQPTSVVRVTTAASEQHSVALHPPLDDVRDVDVLFLKLSTETAGAREALQLWVDDTQRRQAERGRRPMVLVDGMRASDVVMSRISLSSRLGHDEHLAQCGITIPLTFAIHRRDAGGDMGATCAYVCGASCSSRSDGPFVVKSDTSSGLKYTHGMFVAAGSLSLPTGGGADGVVLTSPAAEAWACMATVSLGDCPANESLIVQEVVPTGSIVYKVYVIGVHVYVKRLRNDAFLAECDTVMTRTGTGAVWCFNSQDKALFPPHLDEDTRPAAWECTMNGSNVDCCYGRVPMVSCDDAEKDGLMRVLAAAVPYLQQPSVLGFGLFGMDLVSLPPLRLSGAPAAYALLDINYFPSFSGVVDAQEKLLQYIERSVSVATVLQQV